MNRQRLYTLLAALYSTQSIGIGFLLVGIVAILRESGASLDQLGSLQGLGLIWALKFLWAPIIDRYGGRNVGHYRFWLIILQTGMVVTLLAFLGIQPNPDNLTPFAILTALFIFFSSTQDIAADAIAVRLVDAEHRGLANGVQVMGGYLGTVLGGGLSVVIYDNYGWVPAILILALMTAIALGVVLTFRETAYFQHKPPESLHNAYATLGSVFTQRGSRQWAFFILPMLFIGISGTYALFTPALKDHGWSLTQIGLVSTVLAAIPAAIAGIIGGWMIRRYGRVIPLVTGTVLLLTSTAMLIPMFSGKSNDLLTILGICLYLGAYSLPSTVIYTTAMDYSREKSAGSDYTVLSSIGMVFSFTASGLALYAAEHWGYVAVAIGSSSLIIFGTAISIWYFLRHERLLMNQRKIQKTPRQVKEFAPT